MKRCGTFGKLTLHGISKCPSSLRFPFTHSDPNNSRDNAEETETPQRIRDWYPKTGMCKVSEKTKWQFPVNVQLPRSRWDSEDEDRLSNRSEKEQESEEKLNDVPLEEGEVSVCFAFILFAVFRNVFDE